MGGEVIQLDGEDDVPQLKAPCLAVLIASCAVVFALIVLALPGLAALCLWLGGGVR